MELIIAPPGGVGAGATIIRDGQPLDLDGQANDEIKFDSAGFALPPGCSVSSVKGVVKLVRGSAMVGGAVAGNAIEISLTDFEATRGPGAGAGALHIIFQHQFLFPAPPPRFVFANDDIDGTVQNPAGNVANVRIEWQAYLDGVPIAPPAGPAVSNAGGGAASPFLIRGSHGTMRQNLQMAQAELRGEVKITLGAANDVFKLPISATILVAWEEQEQQQRIRS